MLSGTGFDVVVQEYVESGGFTIAEFSAYDFETDESEYLAAVGLLDGQQIEDIAALNSTSLIFASYFPETNFNTGVTRWTSDLQILSGLDTDEPTRTQIFIGQHGDEISDYRIRDIEVLNNSVVLALVTAGGRDYIDYIDLSRPNEIAYTYFYNEGYQIRDLSVSAEGRVFVSGAANAAAPNNFLYEVTEPEDDVIFTQLSDVVVDHIDAAVDGNIHYTGQPTFSVTSSPVISPKTGNLVSAATVEFGAAYAHVESVDNGRVMFLERPDGRGTRPAGTLHAYDRASGITDSQSGIANVAAIPSSTVLFVDSGQLLANSSSDQAISYPGIALGDLDDDGDLDAFVAGTNFGEGDQPGPEPNLVFFTQDGITQNGRSEDSGQRLGNRASFDVQLADFDNDGDLDAFVANDGPNAIWLNDGQGNFTDSGQLLGDSTSFNVRLGDLDGDGDTDAVVVNTIDVSNGLGGTGEIWINQGIHSGIFQNTAEAVWGTLNASTVALGDVDNDGDLDAFVVQNGDAESGQTGTGAPDVLLLNNGDATFVDSRIAFPRAFGFSALLEDFDGDGDLDIFATGSREFPNGVSRRDPNLYYTNLGGDQGGTIGTFSDPVQITNQNQDQARAVAADFDNDGDIDVFVPNLKDTEDSNDGQNRVYVNQGGLQGGVEGEFVDNGQQLGNEHTIAAAAGDINGDGLVDLFITNGGSPNQVLWNRSATAFTPPQNSVTKVNVTSFERFEPFGLASVTEERSTISGPGHMVEFAVPVDSVSTVLAVPSDPDASLTIAVPEFGLSVSSSDSPGSAAFLPPTPLPTPELEQQYEDEDRPRIYTFQVNADRATSFDIKFYQNTAVEGAAASATPVALDVNYEFEITSYIQGPLHTASGTSMQCDMFASKQVGDIETGIYRLLRLGDIVLAQFEDGESALFQFDPSTSTISGFFASSEEDPTGTSGDIFMSSGEEQENYSWDAQTSAFLGNSIERNFLSWTLDNRESNCVTEYAVTLTPTGTQAEIDAFLSTDLPPAQTLDIDYMSEITAYEQGPFHSANGGNAGMQCDLNANKQVGDVESGRHRFHRFGNVIVAEFEEGDSYVYEFDPATLTISGLFTFDQEDPTGTPNDIFMHYSEDEESYTWDPNSLTFTGTFIERGFLSWTLDDRESNCVTEYAVTLMPDGTQAEIDAFFGEGMVVDPLFTADQTGGFIPYIVAGNSDTTNGPEVDSYIVELTGGLVTDIFLGSNHADGRFRSETLELLNADGDVIATARPDIITTGVNSTNIDLGILDFNVPSTGPYTLRLTSETAGDYQLSVLGGIPFNVEPDEGAAGLQRDITVSGQNIGSIDAANDPHDFVEVDLIAGQPYQFRTWAHFGNLDSPDKLPINDLDMEIRVLDAAGTQLAHDADSGCYNNGQLTFTPPSDGTYSVQISAESGAGEYSLSYRSAEVAQFQRLEPFGSLLAFSSTSVGNLCSGEVTELTVELDGGQSIAGLLEGEDLTTEFSIEIVGVMDAVSSTNGDDFVAFGPHQVPEAGTYTIRIRNTGHPTTASLVLLLNAAADFNGTDNNTPMSLDYSFLGHSERGRWGAFGTTKRAEDGSTATDTDEFTFTVTEDFETVDILLTGIEGQTFDGATLELLNPAGTVVATGTTTPLPNDTAATNVDQAIVNFALPSTGVYTVRITETVDDPNASDVGYTLVVGVDGTASLEPNNELNAALRNITDTQDAVGYLDGASDTHDIYLLDLTVGETVTLSTKSPADPQVSPVNTLDPELEILSTDGTSLATDQDSYDGTHPSLTFTPAESGTYFVRVAATAGAGEYRLKANLETSGGGNNQYDYGDAPDAAAGTGTGNYQTTHADNGPRHAIGTTATTLYLGASVDTDDGTLQNLRASADDTARVEGNDEDGVVSPQQELIGTVGAAPSVTVQATNNTGVEATLFGWIDYNQDGVFDNTTERTDVSVPDGTTNGRFRVTFPTIPEGSAGQTYARFRLSTDAAAADAIGYADGGEVEDYPFSISVPTSGLVSSFTSFAGWSDSHFGWALASIGDLNGDGVPDFAVGAQRQLRGNQRHGAVYIEFMNADGTVQSQVAISTGLSGGPSLADGDLFGTSVAAIGDVNGDGVIDLGVGASGDSEHTGAVYILLMNAGGTVSSHVKIGNAIGGGPPLASGARFGIGISSIGDFDGDGVPDVVVTQRSTPHLVTTHHIVMLNRDGTAKSSVAITGEQSLRIASIGDLDGDGITDLVLSSFHVLFLNADGSVREVRNIAGEERTPWNEVVASVAAVGDLDGNGVPDLAVGVPGDDSVETNHGGLFLVLMNADGTARDYSYIGEETNGGPAIDSHFSFGWAVTSLGDVNGDGITDLAVGDPDDHDGPDGDTVHVLFLAPHDEGSGYVQLGNGLNGSPQVSDGSQFGHSIADIGDLDGDGVSELAVGAPGEGSLYVQFMNADGTVAPDDAPGGPENGSLGHVVRIQRPHRFGASVTDIGDLDGDGIDELFVGANAQSGTRAGGTHDDPAGYVLFLNADGTIRSETTLTPGVGGVPGVGEARWGSSATALGDIDGDGIPDIAIGQIGITSRGWNHGQHGWLHLLYLNSDGTVKGSATISHPRQESSARFGSSVTVVGDINGDGVPDLAVGAAGQVGTPSGSAVDSGAVHLLFMNADGEVESQTVFGAPEPRTRGFFGSALASPGDLDGDSVPDLIVGATEEQLDDEDYGSVYVVFLNADGTPREIQELRDLEGDWPDRVDDQGFGSSLAVLGDPDGDGKTELAVGASGADTNYGPNRGAVFIVDLPSFASTPTMTLQISNASISENRGQTTATITRNIAGSEDLIVTLSSSDVSEATVPASVTIPAGQTSVEFNISAADDNIVDGDVTVTVSASATGYEDVESTIVIEDDDVAALTLTVSEESVIENGGASAATGTVSRNTPTDQALVVSLSSSDTSEATIPTTVTIPAGSTFVEFAVAAIDDADVDGNQTVTLEASATGYTPGTVTLDVIDNESAGDPIVLRPSGPVSTYRPEIIWTEVVGAASYEVWMERIGGDANPILNPTVETADFVPDVDLGIGSFRAWVRANFADGSRSGWGASRFRIDTALTINELPFHGTDPTPTITWPAQPGAASYRVYISNVTGNSVVLDKTVTTNSYTPSSDFEFGKHRIWVRGISGDGFQAKWSKSIDYYIGPDQIDPVKSTSDTTPTFEWESMANVASVQLYVSQGRNVIVNESGLTTTSFTVSSALEDNLYRWWIRPTHTNGRVGEWSPMGRLEIGERPIVFAPEFNTSDSTIQVAWGDIAGAGSYEIYLYNDDTSSLVHRTTGITRSTYDYHPLPDGNYRVWIRSYTSDGQPDKWSRPHRFVLEAATSRVGVTLAGPIGSTFNGEPTFSWTADSDAASFDFYATDGSTVIEEFDLTDTSYQPIFPLAAGPIEWYVRAKTAAGDAGPWFSAEADLSARPVLIQIPGPFTDPRPALFWEAVNGAVEYDVFISGESDFLIRERVTTTEFFPEIDLPSGEFRVWIQAINEDGLRSPWSFAWDFTVASESSESEADSLSITERLTALTMHDDEDADESVREEADSTASSREPQQPEPVTVTADEAALETAFLNLENWIAEV